MFYTNTIFISTTIKIFKNEQKKPKNSDQTICYLHEIPFKYNDVSNLKVKGKRFVQTLIKQNRVCCINIRESSFQKENYQRQRGTFYIMMKGQSMKNSHPIVYIHQTGELHDR